MFMVLPRYTVAWEDQAGEKHQLSVFGGDKLRHLLDILSGNSFRTISVTSHGDGLDNDYRQTTVDDAKLNLGEAVLDLHQGV